jgi:prepilin-type processing-associated H-X9-DG protein
MIQPYVKSTQLFSCPSSQVKPHFNFGDTPATDENAYGLPYYFDAIRPIAALNNVAGTIFAGESTGRLISTAEMQIGGEPAGSRAILYRHLDTANFLFCDGHVKALNKGAAETVALTEGGATTTSTDPLSGENKWVLWNNH